MKRELALMHQWLLEISVPSVLRWMGLLSRGGELSVSITKEMALFRHKNSEGKENVFGLNARGCLVENPFKSKSA